MLFRSQAGNQADENPQAVLGAFAQQLLQAHGLLVELHALVAVTLGDFFAPHEDPSPDTLRAGITAPHASGENRNEEQAEGADDQQPGQQGEILRPEGGAEDEELAFRQVPPDGLAVIPAEPDGAEVEQEQAGTTEHAQIAEQAGEGTGIDFLSRGVEVDAIARVFGRRGNVMYRYLVAHHCIPRRWRFASASTCQPGSN